LMLKFFSAPGPPTGKRIGSRESLFVDPVDILTIFRDFSQNAENCYLERCLCCGGSWGSKKSVEKSSSGGPSGVCSCPPASQRGPS
jgi:hypothetical protein